MKAVKGIERKYYKYAIDEHSWENPKLSDNGILGGDRFACSSTNLVGGSAYLLYDKINNRTSTADAQSQSQSGEHVFYNPNPIKLQQLIITGWADSNWNTQNHTVYACNDGISWQQIFAWSNQIGASTYTWDVNNNDYYKYFKIVWNYVPGCRGMNWREIRVLGIEQIKTPQPSTPDDYDYYEDVLTYKLPKITERKYYKYKLENWTCPKATGYTTPIDGGNMIISAIDNSDGNYEWRMLDGDKSTSWMLYNRGSGDDQKHRQRYITFPYDIFVTGLSFYSRTFSGTAGGGIKTCRFYTDSTLSTPIGNTVNRPNGTTEITSVVTGIPTQGVKTNTIFIDITDGYIHSSEGVASIISEIYITGKKVTGTIEATEEDYDYYIDEPVYYGINQ